MMRDFKSKGKRHNKYSCDKVIIKKDKNILCSDERGNAEKNKFWELIHSTKVDYSTVAVR